MKKLIHRKLIVLSAVAISFIVVGCSRQQKEARYMEQANRDFEREQFDKARVAYMNVVKLNPRNEVAWMRLGLIASDMNLAHRALVTAIRLQTNNPTAFQSSMHLQTNNIVAHSRLGKVYVSAVPMVRDASERVVLMSNARKEALFVLEKDPLNAESIFVLGSASRTPQEVKDAIQLLEKLPKEASQKPHYHFAFALLYLRQTNAVAAEAAYKRVLAIDPRTTRALTDLGSLYQNQRRLKEADDAFRTAAELMPLNSVERLQWAEFKRWKGARAEARAILEEMVAKSPGLAVATLTPLAEIAIEEKRFNDARSLVGKVLAKNPRNFEAMFLEAKIKIAEGDLTNAVKDLERLATQYSGAKLQYELAMAEKAIGNFAKANVAVEEAIKQQKNAGSDYVEAQLLQAELFLQQRNVASAIVSLERLTRQHTNLVKAYFLLAAGYVQQNSLEEALNVYRWLSKNGPTNAQEHVQFLTGSVYAQQRKWGEARTAFSKALEMNPENLLAARYLIGLDVIERKFDSALRRAEGLVRKDPESPDSRMIIARIYRAQGNAEKQEAVLKQILEASPDYSPAFFELARIDLAANRLDAANDKLQKLLQKSPKDTTALLQLGMLHESKGELDNAALLYERAVKEQPTLVTARNNLAYVLAEQGKSNAYEHARQARDLAPADPNVADTLGWVLYKRRDYSEALPLFVEAAGNLVVSAEVVFHLATTYYMLGDEAAARAALQRCLALEPNFRGKQEAERELAIIGIDASRINPQQLESLKKHLEQHPSDPAILSRLGAHYERTGSTAQAIDSYERALKSNPKSLNVLVALGRLYSSQTQDLADVEKALDRSSRARALAPDDPRVRAVLSQLANKIKEYIASAEKNGRQKDALILASRARDFWPEDSDFARALGRLRFEQQDFAGTIPLLREVVRADKADAEIFYMLGIAYNRMKDNQESRIALQKAIVMKLSGPQAEEVKRIFPELRQP